MFNSATKTRRVKLLAEEIELTNIDPQEDTHQVEITGEKDKPLDAGTIAWFTKGKVPNAQYQPIQKDGSGYVMTVALNGVVSFSIPNGSVTAIKGIPTGLASAAGALTWSANVISGRKG